MDVDQPVIAMDWLPNAKGTQEMFAVGNADGSFKLITKMGRIEK